MAVLNPSEYATNWNSLSGGSSSLGNPADLGPYRGAQQTRGATYDNRANAQYDWGVGKANELDDLGRKVTDQALDTSKVWNDYATSDRNFWEGTYKPAMQEQMDFARGYTTDARKAANRGGAMADVGLTFDSAADMSKRALQGYGVNPNSGAFIGLDAGLAASRAKALAGAGTKSDRDTEMLGQQYLQQAINTGANLPGQALNEAGVGIAAGNQAVNTGIAVGQAGRALTEPTGWVGAGDAALQEWKNSLLQQTSLGMQQNDAAQRAREAEAQRAQGSSSGIGSMVGTGLGILGGVVGSIYGGPVGGMMGSSLGKMAGGALGGATGGGGITRTGSTQSYFAEGGMVEDDPEQLWDWDENGEAVTPGVSDDNGMAGENPNMVPPEASPSGGAATDDVTAQVNVGEFVMPKDVTAWFGEKYMQGMIEKARKEMAARTAEPSTGPAPAKAMAISPTFQSEGAMAA